ncbi:MULTISPECIES: ImmA/IrrE family metallo-endopeptidase [Providencia]|uniref:ImmA/IrrE family metallo-endopeptidase n=1 Tax=Providencia TaxID=586 RepID=UPI00234B031F|nr:MULTISPECIES: ImmA/IrrE family metallo-endopeptidase [unclassified Providencia]
MATIELKLSPTIIEWIAQKQGVTPNHLAETLAPKKPHKLLVGEVSKTVAEKLAKLAGIPFGYLFLDTPPTFEKINIPDFRTTMNNSELSRDFFDTYRDVQYKIEWYKEYLKESDLYIKLPFVGKFSIKNSIEEVSNSIINEINFDIEKTIKSVNASSYFGVVTKLIEDAGILVFKNSLVGNNPHRKLDISEFRGFSIIDQYTPAVFINAADAFSAQVFTLFHEVAHIWIGKGGISDWDYDNKIEAFCNKVAAEILMPATLFEKLWKEEQKATDDQLLTISNLSKIFKMSIYAIAIKAKNLDLIDEETLSKARIFTLKITGNAKKGSGGSMLNTLPYRNSPKITDTVILSAVTQRIPLREAGNLLNVKADTVMNLYRKRTFNNAK